MKASAHSLALLFCLFVTLPSFSQNNVKLLHPLQHNYNLSKIRLVPLKGQDRVISYCDNDPILYDLKFGISLKKLGRHNSDVFKAASYDPYFVTLGGEVLHLWNKEGEKIQEFSYAPGRGIRDFDVRYPYVLGGGFEDAWVWHMETKKLVSTAHLGYDSWSEDVQFINKGKYFLTLGTLYKGSSLLNSNGDWDNHETDHTFYVWDTQTGLPVARAVTGTYPIGKMIYDSTTNSVYVTNGFALKRYVLPPSFRGSPGDKKAAPLLTEDRSFALNYVQNFDLDATKQHLLIDSFNTDTKTEAVVVYKIGNRKLQKIRELKIDAYSGIDQLRLLSHYILTENRHSSQLTDLWSNTTYTIPAKNITMLNEDYFLCNDEKNIQIRRFKEATLVKELPIKDNFLVWAFQNRRNELGLISNNQTDLFTVKANKKVRYTTFDYEAGNSRFFTSDSLLFSSSVLGGNIYVTNMETGENKWISRPELFTAVLGGATSRSLFGNIKDTIVLVDKTSFVITKKLPQPQLNHFVGKHSRRLADPLQNPQKLCSPVAFSDDEKYFAYSMNDSTLVVSETASNRLLYQLSIPIVGNYSEFSKLQFLKNSDTLLYFANSGEVYRVDVSNGNKTLLYTVSDLFDDVTQVVELKDNTGLVIMTDINAVEKINKRTGKSLWKSGTTLEWVFAGVSKDERYVYGWDENGTITLLDMQNGQPAYVLHTGSGSIRHCFIEEDSDDVIVVNGDLTVLLFNRKTGQPFIRLIDQREGNHFTITSENFYASPKESVKDLFFQVNNQLISPYQLDMKYNRPDKVLEKMRYQDTALISSFRTAYLKRLKKSGIEPAALNEAVNIPQAVIANGSGINYEHKNETLSLSIQLQDSKVALERFNVWINGVPVYGRNGLSLRQKNTRRFDTTLTVKLTPGMNEIETAVTNRSGMESYRMPLTVSFTPAVAPKEKIYFIGIGIDRFEDNRHNLNYSVKDVRDLSLKLKEKFGTALVIDTLFNENVTTQAIMNLKKKLLHTAEHDKVILAYSGHGLLSKAYDYYLSTYAVNFQMPEQNGLPYDALEDLLDSIPARKKLMLIDACHSGEVDKEEMLQYREVMKEKAGEGLKGLDIENIDSSKIGMKNSFELMQELFLSVGKTTGATIISAAAGTQLAQERGDLQNGVFTYSILEYMNMNPSVTVNGLKSYVNKRVPELTNGLQIPTTRSETKQVDWKVW